MPNEDQQLRPGMRGQADIATSAHPLAWNLFHKAWDALWRSDPAAFLAENKVGTPQNGAVQLARRPRDDEADLSRGATELRRPVAPRLAATEDPETTRN